MARIKHTAGRKVKKSTPAQTGGSSPASPGNQPAAEDYVIQLFEDSNLCAIHAKRVTLMSSQCHLFKFRRGSSCARLVFTQPRSYPV
ncbi:histone H3.2-like isoform X1 [Malus domestica]|uniref:histone H3.2-like isoform X1 n=1 Tax=Malus domestica TaxID=3750 RepID=UPI003976D6FF